MMNDVCAIDLFVHRVPTTMFEILSFRQLTTTFPHIDLHITYTDGVDIEIYKRLTGHRHLKLHALGRAIPSQRVFNEQCITQPWYWERFLDYEFILHYELDAWVFSDQLQKWCDRGYDFVGAPWPQVETVGNSGFSLIKVRKALEVAKMDLPDKTTYNVDWKWLKDYKGLFNVPSWQEAAEFSIELWPRKMFEINGRKIPFGCHNVNFDRTFWKQFIPGL